MTRHQDFGEFDSSFESILSMHTAIEAFLVEKKPEIDVCLVVLPARLPSRSSAISGAGDPLSRDNIYFSSSSSSTSSAQASSAGTSEKTACSFKLYSVYRLIAVQVRVQQSRCTSKLTMGQATTLLRTCDCHRHLQSMLLEGSLMRSELWQ